MPKKIPGTHRKKTWNKSHYKKPAMHASELELILRSRENQKKIVCGEKETVFGEKEVVKGEKRCYTCCIPRDLNINGSWTICTNCANLKSVYWNGHELFFKIYKNL